MPELRATRALTLKSLAGPPIEFQPDEIKSLPHLEALFCFAQINAEEGYDPRTIPLKMESGVQLVTGCVVRWGTPTDMKGPATVLGQLTARGEEWVLVADVFKVSAAVIRRHDIVEVNPCMLAAALLNAIRNAEDHEAREAALDFAQLLFTKPG